MTKTIAALLTVFNRKEKTLTCLQNLFAQELPEDTEIEVFMVNDGCTDGTPQAVREQFPSVNIIEGNGNLYWNRGMHLAWKTASTTKQYDFYFWLNDDTFLVDNALTTLIEVSKGMGDKAIIAGTTCEPHDPTIFTYGGITNSGQLVVPQYRHIPCDYFHGNIVLIPLYVYEKIGLNDPVFRHALGDFDYGKRAKKMGIRNILAPGILGKCESHETLPVWCDPKVSLKKRWKAFRAPLGNNPEEFLIYTKRHGSYSVAYFHYATNHIRVVLPWLWEYKRDKEHFVS